MKFEIHPFIVMETVALSLVGTLSQKGERHGNPKGYVVLSGDWIE